MKLLYVSKPQSPESRLIIDGLNETEEGPEEVFPIRLGDPAAARAVSAYIEAGRAQGFPDRVLEQAKDFLRQHSLYKAHYGLFTPQGPNLVKKETHQGYVAAKNLGSPPRPQAPQAPEAPKAPTLKPKEEIGQADGGAQELLDAVKPEPKKRGRKPGVPNKRARLDARA